MNIITVVKDFINNNNIKNYWRKLDIGGEGSHVYSHYINYGPKEQAMFPDIIFDMSSSCSFLEIGCNAGRVCSYLYEQGYQNITGFDINHNAIEALKNNHNKMYEEGLFFQGEAKKTLKKFKDDQFDLVFTKGVLFNIGYSDIETIFDGMARVSSKYILVFEGVNYGNFQHDYMDQFTSRGYDLVLRKCFPGSSPEFWKKPILDISCDEIYGDRKELLLFQKNK